NAARITPAASRGTVLIADKMAAVCAVLARIIVRCGFTPLIVAGGVEVLHVVRSAPADLCCAFLGVSQVHIDGITLAVILAQLAPSLPVVLMSGYPAWMLANRLQQVPRAYFLEKPFALAGVCALLTEIVPLRERAWGEATPT
ncbi:MAG: hypothetical protein H7Y32_15990, partial [Chloroflexales bacterium]|nr:hypothetical protein [Chloroflexales bacterium]